MELATKSDMDTTVATDGPSTLINRALDSKETRYMQGAADPVTSSALISNSKFLNSPNYRDAFAQMALRRHGHDLPNTYVVPHMIRAIIEVKDMFAFSQLVKAEKKKNSEFAEWLDARRITRYTPEMLEHHASGTLGATIRTFIVDSGMSMEFMMQGEAENDLDYMAKRRVLTHDIEHMVTGFGPNQYGEEALAICNVTVGASYFTPELAQMISDFNVFVSVCSYKRVSLHYPAAMPGYLEAMRRGISAGQVLKKPLFMVQWEDYLDRTPDQICAELGIERGPGAEWKYSDELASG